MADIATATGAAEGSAHDSAAGGDQPGRASQGPRGLKDIFVSYSTPILALYCTHYSARYHTFSLLVIRAIHPFHIPAIRCFFLCLPIAHKLLFE